MCCLMHVTIIILKHILNLGYLGPCLALGLFMSYFCDLFFIFSLIFITINNITSWKEINLFFLPTFLDDNVDVDEESK